MDTIYNTLEDGAETIDFVGTPTRGKNRLVSSFNFFTVEALELHNSLTVEDTIENSL